MTRHTLLPLSAAFLLAVALLLSWKPARAGEIFNAEKKLKGAKLAIGQPDLVSGDCNQPNGDPTASNLCEPEGGGAGGARKQPFYIPDSGNNRVLGFKKFPKKSGTAADFVLGQPNFTSSDFGDSSTSMDFPSHVVTDGTRLYVVDFSNSRVLIWNTLPTTTNKPADVVVGQSDFGEATSATTQSGLNHPDGLCVAGGKLLVSDRNNNRVMIWNSIPTSNGADADVVIGQSDFTTKDFATTQNSFNVPEGIWCNSNRVVVADSNNNRVLIWNNIPASNGASANVVVGQADFTSGSSSPPSAQTMHGPIDVYSDGKKLFVADASNNRILVYNGLPGSNNAAANSVLGASDLVTKGTGAATAGTFGFPDGLSLVGTKLVVADFDNDRDLIFNGE